MSVWSLANLTPLDGRNLAFVVPPLRRAKCGLCLTEFDRAPITELGDQIVHVACVP